MQIDPSLRPISCRILVPSSLLTPPPPPPLCRKSHIPMINLDGCKKTCFEGNVIISLNNSFFLRNASSLAVILCRYQTSSQQHKLEYGERQSTEILSRHFTTNGSIFTLLVGRFIFFCLLCFCRV